MQDQFLLVQMNSNISHKLMNSMSNSGLRSFAPGVFMAESVWPCFLGRAGWRAEAAVGRRPRGAGGRAVGRALPRWGGVGGGVGGAE